MTRRRYFIGEGNACYHLSCRLAEGQLPFSDKEKGAFIDLLERISDFSGVPVITFSILDDRFHLLVEVPSGDAEVSDEELVARFERLYPVPMPWEPMKVDDLREHLDSKSPESKQIREKLLRRMSSLSWFMKTLNQRFAHWLNRTRERFGTVWATRYSSLLVENDPWALQVVAAYIDLSPVRDGLVDHSAEYPFCGYGKAAAGEQRAIDGLQRMDEELEEYEELVVGPEVEDASELFFVDREKFSELMENEETKFPLYAVLRSEVRYFIDGHIIGCPDFVDRQLRQDDTPRQRARKARLMRGADWGGMAVGTGLKTSIFY